MRNYLTHYDSKTKIKTNSHKHLREFLLLYMRLEALFQLHFLRLIGMEIEFIETIVNRNHKLCINLGWQPSNSSSFAIPPTRRAISAKYSTSSGDSARPRTPCSRYDSHFLSTW